VPEFSNSDGTWWAMGAILAVGATSAFVKPAGSRFAPAPVAAASTIILEEAVRAVIREGTRRHEDACRDPRRVEEAIDRLCTKAGQEKAWRVVRALEWSNPVMAAGFRWGPPNQLLAMQRQIFDRVMQTLCTPKGRRSALAAFARSCPPL